MIARKSFKLFNLQSQVQNYFSKVAAFSDFKQSKTYLDKLKPRLAVIYFHSSWNPLCEKQDKDFEQLSNKFQEYQFISIDTDKAILARKYFGVKVEPEYLLLFQGQEMKRQTGQNAQKLEEKLKQVKDYVSSCEFPKGTDQYEEFHEQFRTEYKELDEEIDEWVR
ncbi:thioredoxin h2, putative [Ichthyophthirius multifiliis]|uniref:Thioredoxin h2, putative n=1 Tax=Ichthyophthirius multifiliis TaxID=5932 RepID=G0QMV2_ICHMU|nr:thioredoxin h2, putative [Ichthyophthirius multifiliis]EGR33462.1 thioredoxin h2, putative [Ichthyophthirius multifiliis]|eukprot:XP_004037448.1 thioredoxin h2, putative [Ichthyophthirius multifiliis]